MIRKLFNNVSQKLSEHFEKKKQEQEEFERMQRHFEFEKRIKLEDTQKQQSLEAAKRNALERAEKLTGIRKLRAINRANRLTDPKPNTVLSKLSERTQRNIHRTQQNKERTKMLREQAKRMREERLQKMRNRRI